MQLELAKDTSQKIKKASELLGIKQHDVIDRAISLYLDNISHYLLFKEELAAWDALSDESLAIFDKGI